MQTQKRKSELLKNIKDELAKFHEDERDLDKHWEQRRNHVHNLKHAIMCLTHGDEKVKEIDSWVGKKIIRNCADGVEILLVDSIRFDKWEIIIHGRGVRLYCGCKATECTYMTVKYDEFASIDDSPDKKDSVVLLTDESTEKLIAKLEHARDAKIANFREQVTQEYDDIINKIKADGIDPDKYKDKKETRLERMSKLRHKEDELYDETGFRMSELVNCFGSDKDKMEFCASVNGPAVDDDPVVEDDPNAAFLDVLPRYDVVESGES